MPGDLVGVMEAAYALERPTQEWLQGVVDAARPAIDRGRGLFAALYDATDPDDLKVGEAATSGMRPVGKTLVSLGTQTAGGDIISRLRWESCGTLTDLVSEPRRGAIRLFGVAKALFGVQDLIGLNAGDPTLRGIGFCAPSTSVERVSEAFKGTWLRIAAHVAAGLRLKRQVDAQALLDGAEAVLDPGGKVQHANGAAEEKGARLALRGAAIALDKARGKLRRTDPERAVELWQALVQGRWSLVDHFERDGRRYLVARKNDPLVASEQLTLRERQVVGFACLGHSNKLIAYELGVATSTVGLYLSSAMKKLGVTTRLELIKRIRVPSPP